MHVKQRQLRSFSWSKKLFWGENAWNEMRLNQLFCVVAEQSNNKTISYCKKEFAKTKMQQML